MEIFTLHTAAWPGVRALSRNPLVRPCDRLEAAVVALAMLAVLAAAACAGALGTMVHDSRAQMYAHEAQSRHPVTATAIDNGVTTAVSQWMSVRVHARWQSNGISHVDSIPWNEPVKVGTPLPIWVDVDGNRIDAPSPVSRADIDAVGVAVVTWLTVVLAIAGIVSNVQCRIARMRDSQWEREIRNLVDNEGHSNRPH
jgi:hypothetical protein